LEKEKKTYETTFIINATLEDPQVEAAIEKVKELITKNGGEILAVEKWGRKRLAYSIKKKNNGYYTLIEFRALGDLVAKLERYYQLDEQTLRYLTVQLDKKALKAKELAAQRALLAEPTEETPSVEPQPAA
jgi:small subunit ribosomal protein S6